MYVVVARFVANPGEGEAVAGALATMIPHALEEPGCHAYIINRSVEDPDAFLLYEQYTDEDAFAAHRETEPFKEFVLGQVVPRLAERSREIYSVVEPVE